VGFCLSVSRAGGLGRAMGRVVPVVAALLLSFGSARVARAEILYNPQGWKFPNIVTAAKEAIHVSDSSSS